MQTPPATSLVALKERTAAASVLLAFFGAFLTYSAGTGTNPTGFFLPWFVFSVLAGLIVGTNDPLPLSTRAKYAAVPSIAVVAFTIGPWIVLGLMNLVRTGDLFGEGVTKDNGFTYAGMIGSSLIGYAFYALATFIVILMSSSGKRVLVDLISRSLKFGPSGLKRVELTLYALVGVLAAATLLWRKVG